MARTPLEQFALAVLGEIRSNELADLDGGWLQDKAKALGLLVRVLVTGPCSEECRCSGYYDDDEWPVECLRYSEHVNKCLQEHKEAA